jgi:hypothetical protein
MYVCMYVEGIFDVCMYVCMYVCRHSTSKGSLKFFVVVVGLETSLGCRLMN